MAWWFGRPSSSIEPEPELTLGWYCQCWHGWHLFYFLPIRLRRFDWDKKSTDHRVSFAHAPCPVPWSMPVSMPVPVGASPWSRVVMQNPKTNAIRYGDGGSFPTFRPSVGHPPVPKGTWARRVHVWSRHIANTIHPREIVDNDRPDVTPLCFMIRI